MKIINNFVIYLAISGKLLIPALGQENQKLLEDISNNLGYPSKHLLIQDYLKDTKSASYSIDSSKQDDKSNLNSDPDQILLSYKVVSNIPSSFYPIIITVAKRGFFETEELKALKLRLNEMQETPMSDGGRLPLGEFRWKNTKLFLTLINLRVSGKKQHINPDFPTQTLLDDKSIYNEMSMSCFINVPESNIDIRISQLLNLPDPSNSLTKVEGGENYYKYSNPEPHDKTNSEINPKVLHNLYITLYQSIIKTTAITVYLTTEKDKDLNIDRSLVSKGNNIILAKATDHPKIESSDTALKSNILSKVKQYIWTILIFGFIGFFTAYFWRRSGGKD